MSRKWIDIGSDVNWIEYVGRWARHIDGPRYHVIRFENCREWGDGATGYHCDLQEVDVSNPQLEQAFASCGLNSEDMASIQAPGKEWAKVEALSSYGAYAPLWQETSKNAHQLIRAAKAESRALRSDPEALEERLDRPVNAIGTSARNYALGRILASDE